MKMETKYFVVRAYRYREGGSWEYNLVGMYGDISTAKQAFHDNMGRIIKPTNDFAVTVLFDCYGNMLKSDYDDTHEEPEPEAETDQ